MVPANRELLPANVPTGFLAFEFGRRRLPLSVLKSARGYYLGTFCDLGPVSRESAEYWPSEEQAQAAMASGEWTQRDHP